MSGPASEVAQRRAATTRLMFWEVRRELWEHRSIVIGPAIIALIVFVASLIGVLKLAVRHSDSFGSFRMTPAPIMLASFVIAAIYASEALQSEKRDRSVFFWKSMPVSDRVSVIAKTIVTLFVSPAVAFALSLAMQVALMAVSAPVLLANGGHPLRVATELNLASEIVIMLYGLAVHSLWFAPIYAWLLFISAHVRRAPLLWAALPFFGLAAFEWLVFRSDHVETFLRYRATGAMWEAFRGSGRRGNVSEIGQLDPIGFLTSSGLWLGLTVSVLLVALAIRARRRQELA